MVRSAVRTPRPRSCPSSQSTSRRGIPEYGDRKWPYSCGRSPLPQAKRRSDRSDWPSGVARNASRDSIDTGIPRLEKTARSVARYRVDRRAHHADLLGRGSGTHQPEDVLGYELERRSLPRTLEEADGAVQRCPLRDVVEQ